MANKIKVKVGQVWLGSSGHRTITRFEVRSDGYRLAIGGANGQEWGFGHVDQDDYAIWDTVSYPMITDVEGSASTGKASSSTATETTLFDLFKQVPNGHCACNIPKVQCKYHGNSQV